MAALAVPAAAQSPTTTSEPAAPSAAEPRDYIADALVFYYTVACDGIEGKWSAPAGRDSKIVDKHCAEMSKRFVRITDKYITPARTFFADKQPADLPTTVVYPFGGGDLLSALVTYPNAREITTISLEHAGDPTRLAKLTNKTLRTELALYRNAVAGLLVNNDSTTENMQKMERGGIPGQLSFHLTGAAAMGLMPVSLKYFTFNDDGTLHYLNQAEIDAMAPKIAKKKKAIATDTDFSEAFSNMELTLRKASDPSAPLIVHRHVSANLANNVFNKSALKVHLESKGPMVAITKAASYLLWFDSFTGIRDYLGKNLQWMASDATGIPNRSTRRLGLQQKTYGTFTGAFLPDAQGIDTETQMVEMWAKQPARKLPFRFGYPDIEKHVHLMITERAAK
jgi:hypothetical protein